MSYLCQGGLLNAGDTEAEYTGLFSGYEAFLGFDLEVKAPLRELKQAAEAVYYFLFVFFKFWFLQDHGYIDILYFSAAKEG